MQEQEEYDNFSDSSLDAVDNQIGLNTEIAKLMAIPKEKGRQTKNRNLANLNRSDEAQVNLMDEIIDNLNKLPKGLGKNASERYKKRINRMLSITVGRQGFGLKALRTNFTQIKTETQQEQKVITEQERKRSWRKF